jgi:hypothetical protein
MALYDPSASFSCLTTTVYSATNELVGAGYTAGGMSLTGRPVVVDGDVAILDLHDAAVPVSASISARGALIDNATQANRAIAAIDFGSTITSTNARFTVAMPTPDATVGLIRVGPDV